MENLLKGCAGIDRYLPDHLTPEFDAIREGLEFDYHIPLMSIPAALGTTLETIPGNTPYIVPHPDWKPYTLPPSDKRKVGLVWAGSPTHGRDAFRSIPVEKFQRFIDACPHIQFYSLQCGPRAAEVLKLTNIISLAETIYDWTDTAQAVLGLDLVISVDTSVVHLAGALGKPCWVLLPTGPDWRWLLGRTDSPWYPQAMLYRQDTQGEWDSVIEKVIQDL